MNLQETIAAITPLNSAAMAQAQARWDSIAKPLNSLGLLEQAIVRIAGMTGDAAVRLEKRGVVVMCADNGVIAQGVTQTDSEVTAVVTENFAKGCTSVCVMARRAHAAVIPVDVGVYRDITVEGVLNRKIMYGTNDMTKQPAMSREQAVAAIEVGIAMAFDLKEQGYKLLATGEMGIGNTTTSSAITAVLLEQPVETVTGCGAGLCSEGLRRKIDAIKKAIALHAPDKNDPLDVLSKVGGLDIAGLVGVYLGGAACKLPVMIDGVISAVAALLAVQLAPLCRAYMLPSHVSKEPAGKLLLDALSFQPMLTCDMCLGEGTGAVAAMPLLDMGLGVYNEMCGFADVDIDQYEKFDS